jgi:hypothetical protein
VTRCPCAAASGVRDGSRPPATGLQEQVANRHKRLWSRAMVVSVMEKVLSRSIRCGSRRRIQVNHRIIVESLRWGRNWGLDISPGRAWRIPAYWPGGARHRGGVSLIRALMLNCGNLSPRCTRERHKRKPREADSIDARHRGGQVRSSDESAVTAEERRGLATRRRFTGQLDIRRSQ